MSDSEWLAPYGLRLAISDPGSILPRKHGETVSHWAARAILASDWLAEHDAEVARAARAEAWQEGYRAATCGWRIYNPYRETADDHG